MSENLSNEHGGSSPMVRHRGLGQYKAGRRPSIYQKQRLSVTPFLLEPVQLPDPGEK